MVTPAPLLVMLVMGAVAARAAANLLPTAADTARDVGGGGGGGWVLRAARPEQRRGGVVSVRLWWRPPELPAAGAGAFLVTWEVAGGALRGNLVTRARCATLSLQPRTLFRVQVSALHGAAASSSRPLVVDTGRALPPRPPHPPQAWPAAVQLAPARAAPATTPATLAAVAAAALLAALGVVYAAFRCLSSSCRGPKMADSRPARAADVQMELRAPPARALQEIPPPGGSTAPENDRRGRAAAAPPATATASREPQAASGASWLPTVELNLSTDWVNAF